MPFYECPNDLANVIAEAMADSGWSFGEIVACIMAQKKMKAPMDATNEQWLEFFYEWMPDDDWHQTF